MDPGVPSLLIADYCPGQEGQHHDRVAVGLQPIPDCECDPATAPDLRNEQQLACRHPASQVPMRPGSLSKWICILDSKLKFPRRHSVKNLCRSHYQFFTRKRVILQNRTCNVK